MNRSKVSSRVSRIRIRIYRHHLPLGVATIACVMLLFATRPYRDWISRLSFATAYPALLLLIATLCMGPFNILRKRRNPISSDLRRDVGIWAGLIGILHAVIGQCVHMRGRPWLYYMYERRAEHLFPFRHDVFGVANYTGLLASLILLVLLASSNDLSLRALGTPGWKKLQQWNYLCFGLTAIHTALYQTTEGKLNTFVMASTLGVLLTVALQLAGVSRRRAIPKEAPAR